MKEKGGQNEARLGQETQSLRMDDDGDDGEPDTPSEYC